MKNESYLLIHYQEIRPLCIEAMVYFIQVDKSTNLPLNILISKQIVYYEQLHELQLYNYHLYF